MVKMHMVSALNSALNIAMKENDNVVILGEDVGVDGGVFRVTENLQETYGEERVIDTPLAEAGIVGCSIGMSLNGLKPIAEIQFSGFSYQAFHHIKQHMARIRQRTNNTMSCPMVLRAPCSGGIRALEHHSESPESFFIHCQGIRVIMPAGPYDAKGLMLAAIKSEDPVIFLETKKIYRSFKEDVPEEGYEIELDKANVRKEGNDLTMISWGAMTRLCEETIEELEKDNISVEHIDLRTLWPLDIKTLVESVNKTKKCIIVQEATRTCSLSSEISAQINERCVLNLEAPIQRVTSWDLPFPQFALENYFLPNKTRIKNAVKKVLEF